MTNSAVEYDPDASSRRRSVLLALPLLTALGIGVCSVVVVADTDSVNRGYGSASAWMAVLDLAAGLGLIAAGAVVTRGHRRGSVGTLAGLAGVVWLSADWVGWEQGPTMAPTLAMVVAPFLLPLLVHLIVAFPGGRTTGPVTRWFVAAVYAATALISGFWALFRDPFLDRYCWRNCTDNDLLVYAAPDLSRSLIVLALTGTVAVGLAAAIVCVGRLARASAPTRRRLAPVLAPASLVAMVQALYAGVLLAEPAENPDKAEFAIVFLLRSGALVALATGFVWGVWRQLRTRQAIGRLAGELGSAPPPGALRAALVRSLGDDHLDVAFWLPERQVHVDVTGQRVEVRPSPKQTVTPIERGGQLVAVVVHDRSLAATHDLRREIGAAARLAVDNERLRAQALAQLSDLQASRARIVERADSIRRQLERNLHDGAQQRLLALSYELQLAEADARSAGDERLAAVLTAATARAAHALVELRDLAHGIHPVILTEAGLGPALATFCDTAPVRVELVGLPTGRLPDVTETAAYVTVTAAVRHAVERCAPRLVATFTASADELHVDIVSDGVARGSGDLTHVADRLGALGGRMQIDGSHVRAVIPCG